MGQVITNLDNIVAKVIGPVVTSNVNVIAAQQAVVDAQQAVVVAQQAVVDAQVLAGVAENEADAAIAARVATEAVAADVAALKADTIVVKNTAVAAKDMAVAKAAEAEAIRAATQVLKDRSQELRDDALDYLVRMEVRYDEFDDRFLGGYGKDPLVDNDGDQIRDGAMFWNTTERALKVYDSIAGRWKSMSESSGALLAADNLADLLDKNAARTNLDVYAKGEVTAITGAISTQVGTNTANISAMNTLLGAHLLDNGSAHSYINQDVTTTGTPRFNSVQLNGGVGAQGLMTWNADEETVDLVTNGSVLQIGQELWVHVRNNTATDLPKGTIVMVSGTVGNGGRVLVAPMNGADAANTTRLVGVTTTKIGAGADGKATILGKIKEVNTTGVDVGEVWSDNDPLYVHPTIPGKFTNQRPTVTQVDIPIGEVLNASNNGTIIVRVLPINRNEISPAIVANYYDKATINSLLALQNEASEISVIPQGNLSSNTVQLALEELQSDINSLLVDTEW